MSYRINRRRRRTDHGQEQGVDDWLMTYADMITLLLCFFAVFLSVSVPREDVFNKAREKVLEKFAGDEIMDGKFPTPPAEPTSEVQYDALPSIVDKYHQGLGQATGEGVDIGEGNEKNFKEQEEFSSSGDRIVTLEMPSAAFFASGSADLSEEGKKLLREIIQKNLSTPETKDYQITVEGHTDDAPINTPRFPSNWELSTGRAVAVVRFFISQGIASQRLRVAGYADAVPKMPNRDTNGVPIPKNQAENRRVVIKLEKMEEQE